MAKQIERIQVTFNILDPDQERLYKYVHSKINSSGFLKRLAQREMDGGMAFVGTAAPLACELVDQEEDFSLGGFI
ncbi:hypothetical protein [Paenibacillus cineris]|uniref:Uncharacterized protein n=1 Tax=Paenibacillus cineris TaxID=237530 RepID=A0ABQ4LN49_9BACL|nr:hypothetical protein [Paenibacillus cineris]GIO57942.1 hypothetical protein J21TS7_62600 [Paenibacillus cineris]